MYILYFENLYIFLQVNLNAFYCKISAILKNNTKVLVKKSCFFKIKVTLKNKTFDVILKKENKMDVLKQFLEK